MFIFFMKPFLIHVDISYNRRTEWLSRLWTKSTATLIQTPSLGKHGKLTVVSWRHLYPTSTFHLKTSPMLRFFFFLLLMDLHYSVLILLHKEKAQGFLFYFLWGQNQMYWDTLQMYLFYWPVHNLHKILWWSTVWNVETLYVIPLLLSGLNLKHCGRIKF